MHSKLHRQFKVLQWLVLEPQRIAPFRRVLVSVIEKKTHFKESLFKFLK